MGAKSSGEDNAGEPLSAAGEAVGAVLLCGGASSRMGTDKASLAWRGETLLQRLVREFKPCVAELRLGTGAKPQHEALGLTCVLDRAPGLGPLAGLEAALETASTPWILLAGCDLPEVSAQTARALCVATQPGDQVVQFGSLQEPEPLFALYHKSVLGAVRGALAAGRRRMTSFLDQDACDPIAVRWLPKRADLRNVNRPEEWARWQAEQEERGA